jgi:hypothetical protein
VDSSDQLSLERRTGYGYETDLSDALQKAELRFQMVRNGTSETPEPKQKADVNELADYVQKIIDSQDDSGRWIVHNDKFRKEIQVSKWNGEYRTEDRISSALFNRNVEMLCTFLEAYKDL